MRIAPAGIVFMLLAGSALAQRPVTIPMPEQNSQIHGDLYGKGSRGLVLAHGGRFNKESWKEQAEAFANAGFTVLAINFRGDRLHADGSPSAEGSDADNAADVLAAVRYLHRAGLKHVSAIGGSLGGDAVGNADAQSKPGEFERVVFLGSEGGDHPEQLKGRKLYLVARNDESGSGLRLPGIEDHFTRAPEPKRLVIVEGTAHAQYLFGTSEGPRVLRTIMEFLSGR